jgi:hypothetical protein
MHHERQLRRLALPLIIAIIWVTWLVAVTYSALLVTGHPYDFEVYYAAAESLRFAHGANIYSTATLQQAAYLHGNCTPFPSMGYVYPPLLAILVTPLTLVSCPTASVVWLLINAALWAISTALLADVVCMRWQTHRPLAVALASLISLGFWPAFEGLFLGQAHLVILVSLAFALWLAERRHPWWAGAALAFGACIKFFPVAVIVYALARGRGRLVGGAAASAGLGLALMLAVTGPRMLVQSVSAASTAVIGQALPGGLDESLIVSLPAGGSMIAGLIGLAFLVVILRQHGDDLLGGAWAIITALLVSPLVWSFYLVWLIPAYCACFAVLGPPTKNRWRTRGAWMLLIALYVVTALPISLQLHPFGVLGLWIVTGALYWHSARVAQPVALHCQGSRGHLDRARARLHPS